MNSQRSRSITCSLDRGDRLRSEVIQVLRKIGVRPRRDLGQSFVVDLGLVERLIELGQIGTKDIVLEVGAGLGTLTMALANRCKKVYAIEIDKRLCSALSEVLRKNPNVEIICGDALKIELPNFQKIVSNPPFSISSRLIFRILEKEFQTATLTFQEEFASRLVAAPGSKDYGRLSVTTQLSAHVEAYEKYPASSFFPQPKTEVRIVQLEPRSPRLDARLKETLNDLLVYVFSQRRRLMKKVIANYAKRKGKRVENTQILRSIGARRVFQVTPREFLNIAESLSPT